MMVHLCHGERISKAERSDLFEQAWFGMLTSVSRLEDDLFRGQRSR